MTGFTHLRLGMVAGARKRARSSVFKLVRYNDPPSPAPLENFDANREVVSAMAIALGAAACACTILAIFALTGASF